MMNQRPQLSLAHSPAYSLPHFVLRAPMIQPYLTPGVCGQGWTGRKIRPWQFSPGPAHHWAAADEDGGGGVTDSTESVTDRPTD